MDRATVERVARLARLAVHEDDLDRFAAQLKAILEHFRSLEEVDTSDAEPAVYAIDLAGRTRPDEPAPGPTRERLQDVAPAAREGFYVVPRVIE